MRGKRAKQLRNEAYGDNAPGHRVYAKEGRTGTVYADARRRTYQNSKGRGREGASPQVKEPLWRKFRRLVLPFGIADRDARRQMLKEMKEKEKGEKKDVGD